MTGHSLSAILKQPHPAMRARQIVRSAFVLGLIVSTILIIFQPFGIYLVGHSAVKMLILIGYGFITFITVLFNGIVLPALLPRIYKHEHWTLGKDLVYGGLINFLTVGTFNLFYSVWAFHFPLSLQSFLFFQLVTLCVGFLPFIVFMLIRHIQLLRKNVGAAASLNAELETYQEEEPSISNLITIISDSGYEQLDISAAAFVYAESADNYVKICYEEQGKLHIKMLRQTLKKLEEFFKEHRGIIRCHRTYIVNVAHVSSFSGNAQGLKLTLKSDANNQIPVSRAMVPVIKALLNSPT